MGSWVFAYHNVAAKHVHEEGIYKKAEKHLVNAENLYRGMLPSSVASMLVFLIEAGVFRAHALPFKPALDVCFGSLGYASIIK